MQDRPTSVELLEAAADFVESEIVPAIQGARQFQARVVANVMRVVAREIKLEDPFVRSEVKALARLLGHDSPHLHSLNDLCAAAVSMGAELTTAIGAAKCLRLCVRASKTNCVSRIHATSKTILLFATPKRRSD